MLNHDCFRRVVTAIGIACLRGGCLALIWLGHLSAATSARGAASDWAEGTPGKDNGASRDYYNRAGQLEWHNKMGDWRDARDIAQGREPYGAAGLPAVFVQLGQSRVPRVACQPVLPEVAHGLPSKPWHPESGI